MFAATRAVRSLSLALSAVVGGALAQTPVWTQRPAPMPLSQCGGLLVYDAARAETVFSSGYPYGQTWIWNGNAWSQKLPATSPPLDYRAGCYDSTRQLVVMVVGNQSTGLTTWEWNGVDWTLRATGGLPARGGFSMTFDAARNVTLLFGGNTGNTDYGRSDLWAWNGTTWTQIAIGGPTPRSGAAMVYDPVRQKVVLFGGEGSLGGSAVSLGDTWEWNGTYWLNHFGLVGPPARRWAPIVWDGNRQRAVMYGGSHSQGTFTDTWEWNGSAWTQMVTTTNPGQPAVGLSYDAVRGVTMTWVNTPTSTTWEYLANSGAAATFTTFGSGCVGPNGTPQLANVAGSVPRIGSTLQLQVTNLPPSPLNAVVGLIGFDAVTWNGAPLPVDLTPLGFTGCNVWLAPEILQYAANTGGTAPWNVTIPMNAFYLGVDVFFQAIVLVPSWNPAGFVFSNAGHGVMGAP